MQGLYQLEIRSDPLVALDVFWKQVDGSDKAKEFAQGLVQGAVEFREPIDALINAAASNWRLDRLSAVDLSVLRIATYELLKRREIPTSVVLNEAIEVVRRFSTQESAAFVNGVLDQIADKLGVKNDARAAEGGEEDDSDDDE